jgi:hypothetical protein
MFAKHAVRLVDVGPASKIYRECGDVGETRESSQSPKPNLLQIVFASSPVEAIQHLEIAHLLFC